MRVSLSSAIIIARSYCTSYTCCTAGNPTHCVVLFEDQAIGLIPCKRVKSGGGTPVVGHEYSVEWGNKKLYRGEVLGVGE